jgi:hypothetical protein
MGDDANDVFTQSRIDDLQEAFSLRFEIQKLACRYFFFLKAEIIYPLPPCLDVGILFALLQPSTQSSPFSETSRRPRSCSCLQNNPSVSRYKAKPAHVGKLFHDNAFSTVDRLTLPSRSSASRLLYSELVVSVYICVECRHAWM